MEAEEIVIRQYKIVNLKLVINDNFKSSIVLSTTLNL